MFSARMAMSVMMATRSPVISTKPFADRQEKILTAFAHDDFARDDLRHERDVLRKDAHLAFHAGSVTISTSSE